MTFGGLIDSHLKAYPKCRTAYEAAEKEKKKSNAARLFGGALTDDGAAKQAGWRVVGLRDQSFDQGQFGCA